jgi:hypothetical protein
LSLEAVFPFKSASEFISSVLKVLLFLRDTADLVDTLGSARFGCKMLEEAPPPPRGAENCRLLEKVPCSREEEERKAAIANGGRD